MSFDTDRGPIYEPENQELKSFYNVLKKVEPTIGGSKLFNDLLEVYEALEYDLKEAEGNEPVIRAV
ncbi:hypothetical protein ABFV99_23865 [Cytobacillus horneckiae]|uniref:hypothetical protein n=1 Tax=Cytobacillus horneckiae TaxID=549687 RepID=UPI0034CD90E4